MATIRRLKCATAHCRNLLNASHKGIRCHACSGRPTAPPKHRRRDDPDVAISTHGISVKAPPWHQAHPQ